MSDRLDGSDSAAPGTCLVTVCTRHRECLFGHVMNGEMRLNPAGEIARRRWQEIPRRFPSVALDAFVVMPNHIHGIIVLGGRDPAGLALADGQSGGPAADSAAAIVRYYKSSSTRRINAAHSMPGTPVWQRGCQEHFVRHQRELAAVREYIQDNPAMWEDDENHPAFQRRAPK